MSFRPAARQFFERRGAPAWANPYVTSGLIGMWDGEWNAGGGVHDANVTTWVDLSGNGLDMISKGEPNFGSNYMTSTKVENLWYTDVTDLMDGVLANGAFSFEACVEYANANNTRPKFLTFGGGAIGQGIWLLGSNNQSTRIGAEINVQNNGNSAQYGTRQLLGVAGGYSNGATYGMRYADFVTEPIVRDNGSITSLPIPYVSKRFAIGFRYSYAADGPMIDGTKIYNARVYNRALTAAEVASNYAIDKARFN